MDRWGPRWAQDFPTIVSKSPHLPPPTGQEGQSRHSLCGKLDHLLAGAIPHRHQRLHVELLLTKDQEALLA